MDFKDQDLLDRGFMSLSCWKNIEKPETDRFWGLEIIQAPGHTQGQINLFLPGPGILIAGDNLLGNTTSVITPPHGHLRTYLKTLDRLKSLKPTLALPAHGDAITDPGPYITSYRRHRFERLEQIRQALGRGPLSSAEIAQIIYPAAHRGIGERMVMSHLQYLLEDEEITVLDEKRYVRISSGT
jgi:glyoxylase-like metal-dependent hydrolase (beta-lactamase superfamily II)